jgi:hypothetical protein
VRSPPCLRNRFSGEDEAEDLELSAGLSNMPRGIAQLSLYKCAALATPVTKKLICTT